MKKKTTSSKSYSTANAIQWIMSVLLFLAMLASIAGVYQTHFVDGGARFGATNGSLALIAFAITAHLWFKSMADCYGCTLKK